MTIFGRNGVIGPEDRRQAIAQLAQQTGMSQAEAEQTVDNVQRQVQQLANDAPATVNTVATEATDALAGVAFWAFLASLLGLVAAVVAAVFGRPGKHEVHDRVRSNAPVDEREGPDASSVRPLLLSFPAG